MAGSVECEVAGDLATVVLDSPGKLNAIDLGMWRRLTELFRDLGRQSEIRCIVLRGEGSLAFASGGDLEEFLTQRTTLEQARAYHDEVALALGAIGQCGYPTVALVQGACIGGGLEIAAACDLRICGESSRFGVPIARLGFSMYPDEMRGLLDLAGPAVLKELLLEGRILTAFEAHAKDIVTRVVADSLVVDEAYGTARRIASGAPLVAAWHKQWIRRLRTGLPLSEEERAASFAFLETEDYREGLAAFFEKRKPQFKAR